MVTGQAVDVSDLFRVEISLPGIPVQIPVLSQVRWIQIAGNGRYRVGMQFASC